MTVKVLYFAGLREAFGTGSEEIVFPGGVVTAGGLRDHIAGRGEPWAQLARARNLRCAVNQAMVGFDAVVQEGDEVAFFPPVTGG
ncbi:MAG TPA: molybdopterin converting factor subunit 1 [Rhodocyclaceae bacterium]|nr:molybdopterin converting factor subunit 1 [Rhodocyclaceae bacterium]